MNVYRTGWSGGPYNLIARFLETAPFGGYLALQKIGAARVVWNGLPDAEGFVPEWFFQGVLSSSFPGLYGSWLEPDNP